MNLYDSSFLCIDIGSTSVRGAAHRVRSGHIVKSAIHGVESADTAFAIKSVIDELERQIGSRFDSAYITGNFGPARFDMNAKSTIWSGEHRITQTDLSHQISQINVGTDHYPMHIIPLRYDTSSARNLLSPIGHIDRQLVSIFSTILYEKERLDEIFSILRSAHCDAEIFMDPSFLINKSFRKKKQIALFIDLGAEFTTLSIWTDRGPVFFEKIPRGQTEITNAIAAELGIGFDEASRIKHSAASARGNDMDRFTPADASYDFSRADLNEILLPALMDIVGNIKSTLDNAISSNGPTQIYLSGGGSLIDGIDGLFESVFGLPVQNIGPDAAVNSLAAHIWRSQSPRIKAYVARREKWKNFGLKITSVFRRKKKKRIKFIPIMPTTLSFDMTDPATYSLFRAGGISMVHVDVMDGFFVDRIVGGIEELKHIRASTNAHLYVHLMTESPVVWATAAANAGADTIIVSTNTAGVRSALRKIHEMGKRCGIALNPETSADILKPVLKEIDDILIMSVRPGRGGQEFDDSVLHKISVLANTRKKYGLQFKITVDGGINENTAQLCWRAGADYLASGSYLANAADFPLAVQSLLKTNN